jgi:hypothetical protein
MFDRIDVQASAPVVIAQRLVIIRKPRRFPHLLPRHGQVAPSRAVFLNSAQPPHIGPIN